MAFGLLAFATITASAAPALILGEYNGSTHVTINSSLPLAQNFNEIFDGVALELQNLVIPDTPIEFCKIAVPRMDIGLGIALPSFTMENIVVRMADGGYDLSQGSVLNFTIPEATIPEVGKVTNIRVNVTLTSGRITGSELRVSFGAAVSFDYIVPVSNLPFAIEFTGTKKGIFGTAGQWYGEWWHYVLFFACFGFIWMWF